LEVLLKLLAGAPDAAIAAALTIAKATVIKHIQNICKKFGIINKWPALRRSRYKRPELIALFGFIKKQLSHIMSAGIDCSLCRGGAHPKYLRHNERVK
jgi:hypothetical protein